MKASQLFALTAFSAALSACSFVPKYERPAAPVPASFEASANAEAGSAADIGWRDFFVDAQLQQLITLALENNRDLRIAAINVEAARAQYRIQRGDLLPDIAVSGAYQAIDGTQVAAGAGGQSGTTNGVTRFYSAGVGITSYELDFFGRIRSLTQAAQQQALAYEENRRSAQISLLSEVASAYLKLLTDQRLLDITRSTLQNQDDSLKLTQQRVDGGADTLLVLRQAQTSVETARSNLALYTRQVAQDRNALTLLLGASLPAALNTQTGLNDIRLTELSTGLPSQLLERRPDIVAAERDLLAANANIGAARAAFFPSITLTANYGTASTDLDNLFKSEAKSWSFAPRISLPIFTGGVNKASLDLARLRKESSVASYEKSIQTAFREVSDSLAARGTFDDQLKAQEALVEAAGDGFKLASMRYDNGVDNYLQVLDAQRSYYGAQQSLESTRLARMQNLVTLYKVLGGGWKEQSASAAP